MSAGMLAHLDAERRVAVLTASGMRGFTPSTLTSPEALDPELAASFLSRAEKAGYKAVVVTLDTIQLSWRERDIHVPLEIV